MSDQGRQVPMPPTPIGARNRSIEEWITETCMKCGYPELSARLSYGLSNAPFFHEHGGWATTFWGSSGRVERGVVQFSRVYWTLPRQLNAYRKNLVIHETCHIIANHIAGHELGSMTSLGGGSCTRAASRLGRMFSRHNALFRSPPVDIRC